MTQKPIDPKDEDAFLASLFEMDKSAAPSNAFLERVYGDAAEVAADRSPVPPPPIAVARSGFGRRLSIWFSGFGGAVAAMAAAMVIGVSVGYADPGAIAGGVSLSLTEENDGWTGIDGFSLDLVDTLLTEG